MDKTMVRIIILICSPCSKEWSWLNNRQHPTIWRRSNLLNELYTLRVWCNCQNTQQCRHADSSDLFYFHQADIGEYLRHEETLI